MHDFGNEDELQPSYQREILNENNFFPPLRNIRYNRSLNYIQRINSK